MRECGSLRSHEPIYIVFRAVRFTRSQDLFVFTSSTTMPNTISMIAVMAFVLIPNLQSSILAISSYALPDPRMILTRIEITAITSRM